MGVRRGELAVQVDVAVHGVDEAVQALTGARVRAVGFDPQFVVLGQVRQRQAARGRVVAARVDRDAVERRRAHVRTREVDEHLRTGFGAPEPQHGRRAEPVRAGGQVELDRHGVDGEQSGARPRFVARQVASHAAHPTEPDRARSGEVANVLLIGSSAACSMSGQARDAEMDEVVDTTRYPLDEPTVRAWREVIARPGRSWALTVARCCRTSCGPRRWRRCASRATRSRRWRTTTSRR